MGSFEAVGEAADRHAALAAARELRPGVVLLDGPTTAGTAATTPPVTPTGAGSKPQRSEVGELAEFWGQRGQLVVLKVKRLEAGELAELRRERGQLVDGKVQPLEVGELTDLRWERGELEIDEFQFQLTGS